MVMHNKRITGNVIVVALLLLIPFIAMQFTDEVNWTPFDFIVAGALLLATGFMFERVIRKVKKIEYRIVIGLVILVAFLLVWAELAVGIFGTPLSGS